ncbi:MAG: hypothetical protein U9N47_00765 [Thermodesulfobacteriota bacterium]|nr:hypothetical protein [Thermodesulfobacteriota bacterium]
MKKIVIKSSRIEPDFSLIASLKALFPECEIQIVFKEVGTVEKRLAGGRPGIYSE